MESQRASARLLDCFSATRPALLLFRGLLERGGKPHSSSVSRADKAGREAALKQSRSRAEAR
jgi:hypothetical protein